MMKKLKLKLEDLRVDTFEVGARLAERGTVLGRENPPATPACTGDTCDACVQATLVFTCECKSADTVCDSHETCATCVPFC
jgi:hypothetical protein